MILKFLGMFFILLLTVFYIYYMLTAPTHWQMGVMLAALLAAVPFAAHVMQKIENSFFS